MTSPLLVSFKPELRCANFLDIYDQVKGEVGEKDLDDSSSALEVSRLFQWHLCVECMSMMSIDSH